jgi:phenylalanyl-tRNA synthetase beta chain
VFLRDASVQTTDSTVRGVRQPMKVAGLAYGDPTACSGAARPPGDFYDMKGDVQALLRRCRRSSSPAPIRRCTRALRRDPRRRPRVGCVGELHPRWRQQWELPHTPLLFELDLDAVTERQVPPFEPVPRFQPAERDIAVIVGDRSPTTSCWRDPLRRHRRLLRDALLFDVYKPQQATAGWR